MKKIKVFSILLLFVSAGIFVAYQAYTRVVQDNTPPVVTCEDSELTVSV